MSGVIAIWTPERLAELDSLVAKQIKAGLATPDWVALSHVFKRSPNAIRLAYQRAVRESGAAGPAPVPESDPLKVAQDRRERLEHIRVERELLEAVAGEKSFRRLLENLASNTVKALPAIPPYKAPKGQGKPTVETVVQKLSDLHGGEQVTAARTRDFNEYSTAILAQRLYQVIHTHISIKKRMERGGGWRFRKLVIALNGDLVSGTIHEIERHSDAKNVIMAVYAVGMLLAQAIRDLAAEYSDVEIFCTSGNHGRLPDARRVQQKDPTRSWDTMIALLAKEHLRETKHVQFHIPDAYSVAYDVEGWTFLQTHGHDVKSWNSIPWYGLNRLVTNLNALEASRRQTIHYWLFGHFHTASSLTHASGESFINGSLIGGNEFSINGLGKSDKPVQWMLMVHPEHGVTSRWPLLGACPADSPSYVVPSIAIKE